MNKLIRELALQAWYYADDNSRDPIGSHGGLYRDKFAELIVRECMKETMDENRNLKAEIRRLKKKITEGGGGTYSDIVSDGGMDPRK